MKIGIDLGGSHIGIGLIDGKEIVDILEKNFSSSDFKNIEENIVSTIVNFIDELLNLNELKIEEISVIGIASPGTISNGKIVKATNLKLYDFDIVGKIKKHYPNTPIQIRNDGKCAALAEKTFGKMKNYDDCLFVNVGTGIGGAAFLGGKMLEPKKYPGFEFGHMIINQNGNKCSCGKNGCFETYASVKVLKNKIAETLGISGKMSGERLREELMENNSKKMLEDIDEFAENLKIGITNLIDIFEPEIVCFGGSFSHYENTIIWEKFMKKMKEENSLFNEELPIITTATLRNNAGIIGSVL